MLGPLFTSRWSPRVALGAAMVAALAASLVRSEANRNPPGSTVATRPPPPEVTVPHDEVDAVAHTAQAPPTSASGLQGDVPVRSRPAFDEIRDLSVEGHQDRALEQLATLRQRYPRIVDRLAELEGDLRMSHEPDEQACLAFEEATRSPHRDFVVEARVERVRCLIAVGDRRAEKALVDLRRRYPRLPQALELRFLLARSWEEAGDRSRAIAVYRDIDMRQPGSGAAADARERLSALAREGASVPQLSHGQRIARVQRLVNAGWYLMAHEELRSLEAMELPVPVERRVMKVAASLARREGRREEATARANDRGDPDNGRLWIRRMTGPRPIERQPTARLLAIIRVGARAGLSDEVNQALDGLMKKRDVPAPVLFKAGIYASGVGDDERVAKVFESLLDDDRHGLAARYHRARALERLDRLEAALEGYEQVIDKDHEDTPYYAFWARQRRAVVEAALTEGGDVAHGEVTRPPTEPRVVDVAAERRRSDPRGLGRELALRLRSLTKKHDAAFPWLPRAADLLELGQFDEAADELHEAFLAWYDAEGRDPFRSGLLSVYRGTTVPRHLAGPPLIAQRRSLDDYELGQLADLCAEIGEHGLTVRFGGWPRADDRPRAYEASVVHAAEHHDLDPDLLFAVMRVESFYSRRIISYAGAIGLTQVMPRTGQFIATQQGQHRFTVDQLLDPEVNVDYGAWYMAMLLDRFDGRVPLAIAGYNGGPYAVQRWLRDVSPNMPLDAFLELIPVSQTHRYVRRVLTHYEAYREQHGDEPPTLSTSLPAS